MTNDQIYTVDAYVASKMFHVTYIKVARFVVGSLQLRLVNLLDKKTFIVHVYRMKC